MVGNLGLSMEQRDGAIGAESPQAGWLRHPRADRGEWALPCTNPQRQRVFTSAKAERTRGQAVEDLRLELSLRPDVRCRYLLQRACVLCYRLHDACPLRALERHFVLLQIWPLQAASGQVTTPAALRAYTHITQAPHAALCDTLMPSCHHAMVRKCSRWHADVSSVGRFPQRECPSPSQSSRSGVTRQFRRRDAPSDSPRSPQSGCWAEVSGLTETEVGPHFKPSLQHAANLVIVKRADGMVNVDRL